MAIVTLSSEISPSTAWFAVGEFVRLVYSGEMRAHTRIFPHPVEEVRIESDHENIETRITELDDSGYLLHGPIPVMIECVADDEYVAVFPETGIAMSGDTAYGAVSALKDQIVLSYELYRDEPEMGPEPRRRLDILEQYIGEKRRDQDKKARGRSHSA